MVNEFLAPENLVVDKLLLNDQKKVIKARVTVEPLESGFGHTIGNALRRVLLSSMPGCAISEVKIEGATHEYSILEGVREDVMEILTNLKRVDIISEQNLELSIAAKGPKVVKAGDIKGPKGFEIANPDLVIANLNEKGSLNAKIIASYSRGYESVDQRFSDSKREREVGVLHIDTVYSPVLAVSYRVENARVASRTNLDKLILEIKTNGTIDPEEAVRRAASVIVHQIDKFVSASFVPRDVSQRSIAPVLLEEIGAFTELGETVVSKLRQKQITDVQELVKAKEDFLKDTVKLSPSSIEKIKEKLAAQDLDLGMSQFEIDRYSLEAREADEQG